MKILLCIVVSCIAGTIGVFANRCQNESDGVLLPSRECQFYVICQGGRENQVRCQPMGTFWDYQRMECDSRPNVVCWNGESTSTTTTTTTTTAPNSTETTTVGPKPPRNRCAGLPDDTLFPSRTDCSMFVTCQGGLEMELECRPDGTMFDYQREVCDLPEHVECYEHDRCADEEDFGVVPSETCSNFHICRDGVKSDEITCVPEGTLFDYNRGVCDHPENVACWTPPGSETTTVGPTTTAEPTRPPRPDDIPHDICRGIVINLLPHPHDCTRFVVCVLGHPTVEQCPPNHIFYPKVGVCGYGNTETCEIDPRWLAAYIARQERQ